MTMLLRLVLLVSGVEYCCCAAVVSGTARCLHALAQRYEGAHSGLPMQQLKHWQASGADNNDRNCALPGGPLNGSSQNAPSQWALADRTSGWSWCLTWLPLLLPLCQLCSWRPGCALTLGCTGLSRGWRGPLAPQALPCGLTGLLRQQLALLSPGACCACWGCPAQRQGPAMRCCACCCCLPLPPACCACPGCSGRGCRFQQPLWASLTCGRGRLCPHGCCCCHHRPGGRAPELPCWAQASRRVQLAGGHTLRCCMRCLPRPPWRTAAAGRKAAIRSLKEATALPAASL